MAENSYEIIIRNESSGGKKSPIANNTDNSEAKAAKEAKVFRKEMVKEYFAFKRVVAPIVTQSIEYGIGTVTMRTGRREQQQRLQFAYDVTRRVYGIGEDIAVGAAVGGLAGAVTSAILSLANSALSIAYAQKRINLAESLENNTLGMLNVRAGGAIATSSGSR